MKIRIQILTSGRSRTITCEPGASLQDILRANGYSVYAPCGGKGACGKCRVTVAGEGEVITCRYVPGKNIRVILPGEGEANILVCQTEYLEDLPFQRDSEEYAGREPYGAAVDIGTTTVVMYFLNLITGQIVNIASFLNPQRQFGADVITRIQYCQEHQEGLKELQQSILQAINRELDRFTARTSTPSGHLEKMVVAGNTTMLHLLLGANPVPIALAPFTPAFTGKQTVKAASLGLKMHTGAECITLPCISAYVGADILAGLAALKAPQGNYLFLDIGTNGEIALVKGERIFTCATAAGPAFEGANISRGMAAVTGAISGFTAPGTYQVIGNTVPAGICGSGIVDIVAYLVRNDRVDETGRLKETFIINPERNIQVIQQDIREIQLAKSAIYSGIKVLMKEAGLSFNDVSAMYLAGGFGNYINVQSAVNIGLLPHELKNRIYPVGNSAVIGALQYLKNREFEDKINHILERAEYIELSNRDEFTVEFAQNMNFNTHLE